MRHMLRNPRSEASLETQALYPMTCRKPKHCCCAENAFRATRANHTLVCLPDPFKQEAGKPKIINPIGLYNEPYTLSANLGTLQEASELSQADAEEDASETGSISAYWHFVGVRVSLWF